MDRSSSERLRPGERWDSPSSPAPLALPGASTDSGSGSGTQPSQAPRFAFPGTNRLLLSLDDDSGAGTSSDGHELTSPSPTGRRGPSLLSPFSRARAAAKALKSPARSPRGLPGSPSPTSPTLVHRSKEWLDRIAGGAGRARQRQGREGREGGAQQEGGATAAAEPAEGTEDAAWVGQEERRDEGHPKPGGTRYVSPAAAVAAAVSSRLQGGVGHGQGSRSSSSRRGAAPDTPRGSVERQSEGGQWGQEGSRAAAAPFSFSGSLSGEEGGGRRRPTAGGSADKVGEANGEEGFSAGGLGLAAQRSHTSPRGRALAAASTAAVATAATTAAAATAATAATGRWFSASAQSSKWGSGKDLLSDVEVADFFKSSSSTGAGAAQGKGSQEAVTLGPDAERALGPAGAFLPSLQSRSLSRSRSSAAGPQGGGMRLQVALAGAGAGQGARDGEGGDSSQSEAEPVPRQSRRTLSRSRKEMDVAGHPAGSPGVVRGGSSAEREPSHSHGLLSPEGAPRQNAVLPSPSAATKPMPSLSSFFAAQAAAHSPASMPAIAVGPPSAPVSLPGLAGLQERLAEEALGPGTPRDDGAVASRRRRSREKLGFDASKGAGGRERRDEWGTVRGGSGKAGQLAADFADIGQMSWEAGRSQGQEAVSPAAAEAGASASSLSLDSGFGSEVESEASYSARRRQAATRQTSGPGSGPFALQADAPVWQAAPSGPLRSRSLLGSHSAKLRGRGEEHAAGRLGQQLPPNPLPKSVSERMAGSAQLPPVAPVQQPRQRQRPGNKSWDANDGSESSRGTSPAVSLTLNLEPDGLQRSASTRSQEEEAAGRHRRVQSSTLEPEERGMGRSSGEAGAASDIEGSGGRTLAKQGSSKKGSFANELLSELNALRKKSLLRRNSSKRDASPAPGKEPSGRLCTPAPSLLADDLARAASDLEAEAARIAGGEGSGSEDEGERGELEGAAVGDSKLAMAQVHSSLRHLTHAKSSDSDSSDIDSGEFLSKLAARANATTAPSRFAPPGALPSAGAGAGAATAASGSQSGNISNFSSGGANEASGNQSASGFLNHSGTSRTSQGSSPFSATTPLAAAGGASSSLSPSSLPPLEDASECRRFSPEQLRAATSGFCESNLLGRGAYGLVYQGDLFGCQVAIKVLEQGSEQGPAEFRTEVEVLSRVRHPHVVLLMGQCPESSAIVYEFLSGGNLQQRIVKAGEPGFPPLQWHERLRIIAEVSGALLFLHQHDPPILHRDLKPDNILLDGNNISKVADVGLARLIQTEASALTWKVRGTAGYIDPEEIQTGELSTKSDIYAFGLIALQLLTGLPNVKALHRKLADCGTGERDVEKATDILTGCLDSKAGRWPQDLGRRAVRIAVRCIERKRAQRPDLGSVVHPELHDVAQEAKLEKDRRAKELDSRFLCPLSKVRMRDPVMAADGHTYERSAVEAWLALKNTSPLTGLPLAHKHLTPNLLLASLLESL